MIRIVLPSKDQILAANAVRSELRDLGNKMVVTLHAVFVSKKLEKDLKLKEMKHCKSALRCLYSSINALLNTSIPPLVNSF